MLAWKGHYNRLPQDCQKLAIKNIFTNGFNVPGYRISWLSDQAITVMAELLLLRNILVIFNFIGGGGGGICSDHDVVA